MGRSVFLTLLLLTLSLGMASRAIPQDQAATASATDSARFSPVSALLETAVARQQVAGAVALVMQNGQPVYRRCVGFRDVATRSPMKEDTLFRVASMTKPITSVCVLQLVEEGKLKLDQPVSTVLPEFTSMRVIEAGGSDANARPAVRSITIHDLLTHTSGLTYGFLAPQPQKDCYERTGVCDGLEESSLTLADDIRRLARAPLVNDPGRAWNYGLSTDVLGRVVEAASGMPFDEYVQARVCQPLGMRDTTFTIGNNQLPRLAQLYRPCKTGLEATPAGAQMSGPVHYSATFQRTDSPHFPSGGAGLVSTAGDYARFLTMLSRNGRSNGGQILKPESVRLMTTNQIGDLRCGFAIHGDGFGYGVGVHSATSDRMGAGVGAYSWGGIFNTYFWVDPERDVVGILMTQLIPFDHLTMWADFQRRTYESLNARPVSAE